MFKNILYVYSDAVDNTLALEEAIALATKSDAHLTVLFTLTDESLPSTLGFSEEEITHYIDKMEQERTTLLKQLSHSISISQESIHNDAYLEVIKKVTELKIDLLIKPSKSEGLIGKIFGSNDMGYLRQCPCPVWLINSAHEQKEIDNSIIAAIDVDDSYPENERNIRAQLNIDVLKNAASIAVAKGSRLKIVSIWAVRYESTLRHSSFIKKSKEAVDTYVKGLENKHLENLHTFMELAKQELDQETYDRVMPESISLKGNPREVIPEYATKVDASLVVMGTVGRVGIPGLIIGNTAENILYRLNQSVLAIKPTGFNY